MVVRELMEPGLETRLAWLSPAERRLYRELGASSPQSAALIRAMSKGVQPVLVSELWFDAPLSDDWTVAVRLAIEGATSDPMQARLVISEVRVFPSREPRAPNTGRWAAEALGSDAPVPRGGLKTAVLRRLTLRAYRQDLKRVFERAHRREKAAEGKRPILWTVGGDERAVVQRTGSKPGRKPLPDSEVATATVLYEALSVHGLWWNRPVQGVAKALRVTPGQARTLIARARERKLLSRTARGEIDGRASSAARRLDAGEASRRLQRFATEVKSGGQKAAQLAPSSNENARQSPGRKKRA